MTITWPLIFFVVLVLAGWEFFTNYRIERREEPAEMPDDFHGTVVEADTLEELISELQQLPSDTDIKQLWIVEREHEN